MAYNSTHTGAEIDAAVDLVNSQKQELENKLNISSVNTGTFDPTSDDPASQANLAGLLTAGYLLNGVRIAYNNNSFRYAFFSLPSLVSGRIRNFDYYYTRNFIIKFNGVAYVDDDYSYLFAGGEFAEFDYSFNIDAILTKYTNSPKNGKDMFSYCNNLTTIGAYDFSDFNNLYELFLYSGRLKHIHIKHFKVSFDISMSTAFEESDLVEIIGNLDSVTTAQTLTMGSTNLAKLTEAEKKVATDKGWTLV